MGGGGEADDSSGKSSRQRWPPTFEIPHRLCRKAEVHGLQAVRGGGVSLQKSRIGGVGVIRLGEKGEGEISS